MNRIAISALAAVNFWGCRTSPASQGSLKDDVAPAAVQVEDASQGSKGIYIAAVNVTSQDSDAAIRNIEILESVDKSGRRSAFPSSASKYNLEGFVGNLDQLIQIGKGAVGEDRIVFIGNLRTRDFGPNLPAFSLEASIDKFQPCGIDSRCTAALASILRDHNGGSGPAIPGALEYRIVESSIGGHRAGSVEGPFIASSQAEWNQIYLSRMNNTIENAVPVLDVDFSREFVWGYQRVAGSFVFAPRVESVTQRGANAHIVLIKDVAGPNCSVLQQLSAPAVLIALPRGRLSGIRTITYEVKEAISACPSL